jgi:hypothetical protein
MKTSIQLIGQIIRSKTALHLKLVAHRNGGKVDIGGERIDDLLAEVDARMASICAAKSSVSRLVVLLLAALVRISLSIEDMGLLVLE